MSARSRPSEAAAVGAALAFGYALWRRSLGNGNLSKILLETVNTTALVFLILIGALVFGPFLALSGLPEKIAQSLAGLDVPRVVILIMILRSTSCSAPSWKGSRCWC